MIPNPYPGVFFVFEGGNGCGKSTQRDMVKAWLEKLNIDPIMAKEPGKNRPYGKKICEDLHTPGGLHEVHPLSFQSWYACDSKENLETIIIPALMAGSIVLADRYRHSLVHSAKNDGDIESLLLMNRIILGEYFIWPDATFIFDATVENAIKRLRKKGRPLDGHESNRELLERTRQNYFKIAKFRNCYLIDANRPPEVIFLDVKRIATEVLTVKEKILKTI